MNHMYFYDNKRTININTEKQYIRALLHLSQDNLINLAYDIGVRPCNCSIINFFPFIILVIKSGVGHHECLQIILNHNYNDSSGVYLLAKKLLRDLSIDKILTIWVGFLNGKTKLMSGNAKRKFISNIYEELKKFRYSLNVNDSKLDSEFNQIVCDLNSFL